MQDERMYRLYVEMTDRHDRRTNVWRRVSSDEPLTHREALTMRSKMMRPAAVLLVEADSQAERDMEPLYKNWSDSLHELAAIRRDKAALPSTGAVLRWHRDALIMDLLSQGFTVGEREICVTGNPGELMIECQAELVEPIRRAATDLFPVRTLLTFKSHSDAR